MAVTKLSLFNNALLNIGERRLSTDTDTVETRYALDIAYDQTAVDACLDMVKPRFALETNKLTSPATATEHGLQYVYSLPSDYVSLHELCSDAELDEPINRYLIENRTIACDYATQVYLRFISNDHALANWSPLFADVVSTYLALRVAPRFAPQKVSALTDQLQSQIEVAIAVEGAKEPARRPRAGSFTVTDDYRYLYNLAANRLGQQQLTSNDDDSELRYALDTVMEAGAINAMYERVKPKFAIETNKLTVSVVSTEHDLDNVFTLPADYICVVEVHSEAQMDAPIENYIIEGDTLSCNYSTVYLRFVSSTQGTTVWTSGFKQLMGAYLADQVKRRFVDGDASLKAIRDEYLEQLAYVIQAEGWKEPRPRSQRTTTTLNPAWLQVYNKALLLLGVDHLVSVDDDSLARVKLDVSVSAGVVEQVLEDIGWAFARTSTKMTYNPSLEPDWGYKYVFDKPSDMTRLHGIFTDEYCNDPLQYYKDEGDRWFCDLTEIYVEYVESSFLTNPSNWPQYFSNIIAAEMAAEAGPGIPGALVDNALHERKRLTEKGYNNDAMQAPPQQIHAGNWSRSRGGYGRGSYVDDRP